jgi:hypothetical protein
MPDGDKVGTRPHAEQRNSTLSEEMFLLRQGDRYVMHDPAGISGDRMLRIITAFLAIVFVVLAGPFLAFSAQERIYHSTRESRLVYTLTLTSSSTLTDVTFFIPLPTDGEGMSPVIQLLGAGNQSNLLDGSQTSIYGANNESYLKISTERLPIPSDDGGMTYSFTVTAVSPAMNTRLPLQYDYTLLPKQNLLSIPCGPDLSRDQSRCFTYEGRIYASYYAPSDVRVEIRAEVLGTNRWRILQEYWNEYCDGLSLQVEGPISGWQPAEGYLVTSKGDENPFWREPAPEAPTTHFREGVDTSMMRWHTFTPLP